MRLRTASVAFLLGVLCTGLAWLMAQPVLLRLSDLVRRLSQPGSAERAALDGMRHLLPLYLAISLVAAALLAYGVLYVTVLRPLRDTEGAIEQLGRLTSGGGLPFARSGAGPLLSRVQSALSRLAEALRAEQATTRQQLEELRDANAQLSRTQTELLASERLATVGRLAAGVAHEVGNPLAGILGYLSLARARAHDAQMADFLARIEAEVQRIDQIVRGLLDLGRPPRGATGPLALRPVVESCIGLVRKDPDLARVEISDEVDPALVVRGEPGPLAQILINLLLNAGQAMGGRGRISLAAAPSPGGVCLHVDDTGPGIPQDALPRLFEPFFTTQPAGKGTGLGLAISQHLAVSMGGRMAASNRKEGGARFTLELPRA